MEVTSKSNKKLIIIGGGAAGFFCAVNAARQDPALEVLIVEKGTKLLSKVKVSGGGRCNATHACSSPEEMARNYPRGEKFMRRTLHAFGPDATVQWFAERGVALKEEADGRMFPVTDDSQTIIDCLLKEASKYHVDIRMQFVVKSLLRIGEQWLIENERGEKLLADHVCIACGGYAKKEQFHWITALGHTIEEPVPSLFTFNMPGNPIIALMGVSVSDAIVRIPVTGHRAQGPLLITHWGMSGPGILRLSAWAARDLAHLDWKFELLVNWLPAYHDQSLRSALQEMRITSPRQQIGKGNSFDLPARLWTFLVSSAGLDLSLSWGNISDKQIYSLVNILCQGSFKVNGKTTFKEEFVTAGGVVLKEIDPSTMQSKLQPGLYFAGEIMNVDGITGGFNFQHAWASGWLAAKAIAGGGPNGA
jgi:predicted Rossmann fold flavoprotein